MDIILSELYGHFIRPYVERQPVDEHYAFYFDRHQANASLDEKDDTCCIRRFYAIHAFLLGLKLGLALAEDLKGPA